MVSRVVSEWKLASIPLYPQVPENEKPAARIPKDFEIAVSGSGASLWLTNVLGRFIVGVDAFGSRTMPMNEQSPDAAAWLSAARAGSRDALGQALEQCRRYLLGIAENELDADLRAKGGASDLVQETFMDAQQLFDRFEGKSEAELLAWLRQMLLYNMAGFARRYRVGKRDADREAALQGTASSAGWASRLPSPVGTPSAAVRNAEESIALESALLKLPDDYQQVLRWRYQDNLTFEVMAQRMARTANAVRKLWVRAIHQLQQEMKAAP